MSTPPYYYWIDLANNNWDAGNEDVSEYVVDDEDGNNDNGDTETPNDGDDNPAHLNNNEVHYKDVGYDVHDNSSDA